MSFPSDPEFLVLHTLRLRGFAEAKSIAAATGLEVNEVTKYLEVFETDALAVHRAGRVSGWTLTAKGRAEGERRAAAEVEAAGARGAVTDAYDRFLELNPEVLQICTEWQLRATDGDPAVNDHTDAGYDAGVIDRLRSLDAAAQPVCADLASVLERFSGYAPRLRHALERVGAGEVDWFAKPTIDSYHTVWFELHENLLATLGIERGKETR